MSKWYQEITFSYQRKHPNLRTYQHEICQQGRCVAYWDVVAFLRPHPPHLHLRNSEIISLLLYFESLGRVIYRVLQKRFLSMTVQCGEMQLKSSTVMNFVFQKPTKITYSVLDPHKTVRTNWKPKMSCPMTQQPSSILAKLNHVQSRTRVNLFLFLFIRLPDWTFAYKGTFAQWTNSRRKTGSLLCTT